jgi:SAM-dependent methyltransferase
MPKAMPDHIRGDWSERFIEPEILEKAPQKQMQRNLQEIAKVNRLFGGYRILRTLLGEYVTPENRFTVLDVGAANGEMGAAIRQSFPLAVVYSLDRAVRHLAEAADPRLAADAFRMPLRPGSFDFVFCSLFLHHFEDSKVVELLAEFRRLARRAVLAIDLERNRIAHRFLPATQWLFGWDFIMLNDGPISVRASFRRKELLALALRAGLREARVRRHDPWFRVSLSAPVENP